MKFNHFRQLSLRLEEPGWSFRCLLKSWLWHLVSHRDNLSLCFAFLEEVLVSCGSDWWSGWSEGRLLAHIRAHGTVRLRSFPPPVWSRRSTGSVVNLSSLQPLLHLHESVCVVAGGDGHHLFLLGFLLRHTIFVVRCLRPSRCKLFLLLYEVSIGLPATLLWLFRPWWIGRSPTAHALMVCAALVSMFVVISISERRFSLLEHLYKAFVAVTFTVVRLFESTSKDSIHACLALHVTDAAQSRTFAFERWDASGWSTGLLRWLLTGRKVLSDLFVKELLSTLFREVSCQLVRYRLRSR